jgi:hypothetical protein
LCVPFALQKITWLLIRSWNWCSWLLFFFMNTFLCIILYLKWKIDRGSFVRSWWSSFFMYLYSTVVQICCTCAKNTHLLLRSARASELVLIQSWCA